MSDIHAWLLMHAMGPVDRSVCKCVVTFTGIEQATIPHVHWPRGCPGIDIFHDNHFLCSFLEWKVSWIMVLLLTSRHWTIGLFLKVAQAILSFSTYIVVQTVNLHGISLIYITV